MRTLIKPGDKGVNAHLKRQFHFTYGLSLPSEVLFPEIGEIFAVEEPMEAIPGRSTGLDSNHCVPRGIYHVGGFSDRIVDDEERHVLYLTRLSNMNPVEFCFVDSGHCVDWRAVSGFKAPAEISCRSLNSALHQYMMDTIERYKSIPLKDIINLMPVLFWQLFIYVELCDRFYQTPDGGCQLSSHDLQVLVAKQQITRHYDSRHIAKAYRFIAGCFEN